MNFFPDQNNNSEAFNGSRSTEQLNTLNSHHPEQTDNIEDVENRKIDPEILKILRKSFIFLIITGLIIGVVVSSGIIYVLNRFDVTGKPQQPQQIEQVQ